MHRLVLSTARRRPRAHTGSVLSAARRRQQLSQQAPPTRPPTNPQNTASTSASASSSADADAAAAAASALAHASAPPRNFAAPTLSTLAFFRRAAAFALLGAAALAGGTLAAFAGAHLWIEHRALAPAPGPGDDPDDDIWGWAAAAERWTGGPAGGTDPALGAAARTAVRAAWAAQHWGAGASVLATNAIARSTQQQQQASNGGGGGGGAIEARLAHAHDFLNIALAAALEREAAGAPLRPATLPELRALHAATLERIGGRGALYDARADYAAVWDAALDAPRGPDARARVALKLGDVSARLGDGAEAVAWWARALDLSAGGDGDDDAALDDPPASASAAADEPLELPARLPDSPPAQRVLAATLSSLSAHYAQAGRLQDAAAVQAHGLALLRTAAAEADASASAGARADAPRALHTLFLQHRAALLALHAAEVAHAQRTADAGSTRAQLERAAALSAHIAACLAGGGGGPQSTPQQNQRQPQQKGTVALAPLADAFAASGPLRAPAESLLRDARRTAMHALTLCGVLYESDAAAAANKAAWRRDPRAAESARREALGCYERAMVWAGAQDGRPGAGVLEGEWAALSGRYARARDAVLEAEGAALKEAPAAETAGSKKA
ncbi:hypothetical protein DFH11DRAFT_1875715 [Phellopilus nigrolimitatus]|nr:hypothetical protein DFH11DRAFT_1875715 [Phellopilus nigrolimitatus]